MTRTIHADTWAQFWRPVIACILFSTVFAALVDFYLLNQQRITGWGAVGIILAGVAVGALFGVIIALGTDWASAMMVNTLTQGGGIKPVRSFSLEESMIARGRFQEALALYEAHLERDPSDIDASLALAGLCRDHLRDLTRTEQILLELRRGPLPSAVEFSVSNQLIDLYRAQGQQGRELAELARFAERFEGTEPGARARAALRRLKADRA